MPELCYSPADSGSKALVLTPPKLGRLDAGWRHRAFRGQHLQGIGVSKCTAYASNILQLGPAHATRPPSGLHARHQGIRRQLLALNQQRTGGCDRGLCILDKLPTPRCCFGDRAFHCLKTFCKRGEWPPPTFLGLPCVLEGWSASKTSS